MDVRKWKCKCKRLYTVFKPKRIIHPAANYRKTAIQEILRYSLMMFRLECLIIVREVKNFSRKFTIFWVSQIQVHNFYQGISICSQASDISWEKKKYSLTLTRDHQLISCHGFAQDNGYFFFKQCLNCSPFFVIT